MWNLVLLSLECGLARWILRTPWQFQPQCSFQISQGTSLHRLKTAPFVLGKCATALRGGGFLIEMETWYSALWRIQSSHKLIMWAYHHALSLPVMSEVQRMQPRLQCSWKYQPFSLKFLALKLMHCWISLAMHDREKKGLVSLLYQMRLYNDVLQLLIILGPARKQEDIRWS